MNKQTARRLAMTAWLGLTRHYPNNMVGLTQYDHYYSVRIYANNGKPDKEEVIQHIPYLNVDYVSLRYSCYNGNEDWQLHIDIGFEFDSTTK